MERMASQVASWSGRGGRRDCRDCLMLGLKMPGFCGAQLFGMVKKNQPKTSKNLSWKMGSVDPGLETHQSLACATCNGANSGLICVATCVLKIMGRK